MQKFWCTSCGAAAFSSANLDDLYFPACSCGARLQKEVDSPEEKNNKWISSPGSFRPSRRVVKKDNS